MGEREIFSGRCFAEPSLYALFLFWVKNLYPGLLEVFSCFEVSIFSNTNY